MAELDSPYRQGDPEGVDSDRAWIRRFIVRSLITVTLGVVALVVLLVVLVSTRVIGKQNAPRSAATPGPLVSAAEPILQLENHTCGLMSLSAADIAHGLSPEDKNLRYRLGVDVAANPFDRESTGTLHPDLFRVLVQDGFDYSLVDPRSAGASEMIGSHLDGGNVVLILIKRRETGGLHWVLADSRDGESVRIVDSLFTEAYTEDLRSFLAECVLSVVTLRVSQGQLGDTSIAHSDGMAELRRVHARMRDMARDR